MGGLVSVYAFFRHPSVFGRAGVMSPSVWFGQGAVLDFIQAARVPGAASGSTSGPPRARGRCAMSGASDACSCGRDFDVNDLMAQMSAGGRRSFGTSRTRAAVTPKRPGRRGSRARSRSCSSSVYDRAREALFVHVAHTS
jgi:hypothetical protein